MAVPRRAIASCSPMAKAMLRPLNHLAMLRVTATPAISEPSPNTMHPAQATPSDCAAGSPESSAQVTMPAPATISPTKMEPVMRTPQRSSSMPQSTRPPKMQSIEYPEVYLPYSSCPQPSCSEPGSLKMFETVLNMSSKKYDPNMGTTSSARAIQAAALPVILNFPAIKRNRTPAYSAASAFFPAASSFLMFGSSRPRCFFASRAFRYTATSRAATPKHAKMMSGTV